MNTSTVYLAGFLGVFLSLAALGIGAAVDMPSTLMSRGDYNAAKKVIEAAARKAMAGCRDLQGSDKDICKAEAHAGERIKVADLEARYHGTVAAAEDAREAHARAGYDVAKARCVSREGNARVECLRAAREDQTRALAEAQAATT